MPDIKVFEVVLTSSKYLLTCPILTPRFFEVLGVYKYVGTFGSDPGTYSNVDDATKSGFYISYGNSTGYDLPDSGGGILEVLAVSTTFIMQRFTCTYNNPTKMYVRYRWGGNWQPWKSYTGA